MPRVTDDSQRVIDDKALYEKLKKGRPKGSRSRFSRDSVAALEALDFDPISKYVELYNTLALEVDEHRATKPERTRSVGDKFISDTRATQVRVLDTLIKYAYLPVQPEIGFDESQPGLNIRLSIPGELSNGFKLVSAESGRPGPENPVLNVSERGDPEGSGDDRGGDPGPVEPDETAL